MRRTGGEGSEQHPGPEGDPHCWALQGRPLQPRQASEDAQEHAQIATEQQPSPQEAEPYKAARYCLAKLKKMLKSMLR
jgi:hypothetical protein